MADNAHYDMEFMCSNCGHKYSIAIRKGTTAQGNGGTCPNCGVSDKTQGVGAHRVIRANESTDPLCGREILLDGKNFQ